MRGALLFVASSSLVFVAGCSGCAPAHERRDAGADAFVDHADAHVDPIDAFVPRDAFAPPDAFVPRDAFVPDAFVPADAFVPSDAFVAPDVASGDAGVPIDGAMCDFVGSFRETTLGFVTTLNADGTWQTVDASGTTVGGTYSRSGDLITFTGTGCSGTYHFVGSGCDAFTLVFVSSGCGTTGSNLSYQRVP